MKYLCIPEMFAMNLQKIKPIGFILFGLLMLFPSYQSFSGGLPGEGNRLFIIERSKNANVVCYDVNFDKRNRIDKDRPLRVYWINHTDRPGEISDLNYIQNKFAYGYASRSLPNGVFEVTLVAFPSRKLFIEANAKGNYFGRIMINGRQAILQKIYVQAKPDNSLKVAWVELYGQEVGSGQALTERIYP